ncbi:MAG: trigger factor [Chloroflexota bacterium]|nr:trigger factor [Chloroflexota bacterium]
MKVSSEKIEGCQMALTIEVEPEEMEKAQGKAYRSLVNKIAVPGFRKGKAPRNMLERHIGKESLEAEALEGLLPELYDQAIKDEGVDAIGQPDIEMIQTEPPTFKATVPVRPVIELGDYHSLNITPEVIEFTEEKVDEAMKQLRKAHALWEPAEHEARLGDMVSLNIVGKVGDDTILENEGASYQITEGSSMPVPGFAEQLVGLKIEEEKEFTLPFQEDHPTPELAGKDCQFKVSISEVKEEHLPDLDDEFVKSLGQDIETAEQLREKMSAELKITMEQESKAKLENQVIKGVVEISSIEFPDIFVEQEIDRMVNDQMSRLGGMNIETFLGYRGITMSDFRNELRPMAVNGVSSSLVLNRVFEVENIEITNEEIDAEIERILGGLESDSEQMQQVFRSPEARDSIRGQLLTQKTISTLVAIATGDESILKSETAVEEVSKTLDASETKKEEE